MQLRLPAQCKQKREALRCQFWGGDVKGDGPQMWPASWGKWYKMMIKHNKLLDSGDSGDPIFEHTTPIFASTCRTILSRWHENFRDLGWKRSIDCATPKSLADRAHASWRRSWETWRFSRSGAGLCDRQWQSTIDLAMKDFIHEFGYPEVYPRGVQSLWKFEAAAFAKRIWKTKNDRGQLNRDAANGRFSFAFSIRLFCNWINRNSQPIGWRNDPKWWHHPWAV